MRVYGLGLGSSRRASAFSSIRRDLLLREGRGDGDGEGDGEGEGESSGPRCW